MTFDKTKAMRNAERYLSQGKIRAAITEYRQVVENDPRDVVTLNMLGDLYAKSSDSRAAVGCYSSVAEHYSKQGFAQKAIAVYNKIARIQPNSLEVSQKLAELYKTKGSLKEAKSHYTTLAEHYSKQGRRIEALEIWTEVAVLDPNNTEVYLTIADAYLQEDRHDEAAEAFCDAGLRLARHGSHPAALEAFTKVFGINGKHTKALRGFVDSKFAIGESADAADHVELLLGEDPHSRELLSILIDIQIRSKDAGAAEKAILKLVEVDPSNYLKCLELAELHLSANDMTSAVRVLNIASEHLLVGGQANDLRDLLGKIDALEPDRLDVVRLLARFSSWQKDDEALRRNLVKLAEVAGRESSLEEERFALSQLVMIMPQETGYTERLKVISEQLGYSGDEQTESVFDKHFVREMPSTVEGNGDEHDVNHGGEQKVEVSTEFESFAAADLGDFAIVRTAAVTPEVAEPKSRNGKKGRKSSAVKKPSKEESNEAAEADVVTTEQDPELENLRREIDSIKFYIDNGYTDLAGKAINELKGTFGSRPEIDDMYQMLNGAEKTSAGQIGEPMFDGIVDVTVGPASFNIDDLRSELGLEDNDVADDSDFDTHFQTAVAYQEMGLHEQAIKEFQDAASLASPNDGTRRFFSCANLLGHCFMEMGKPNLAVKWYLRTLETVDISDDERQGLWYELGHAYEAGGDYGNAGKYFEQVYSENIDFRDIGERIKNLAVLV